MTQKQEQILKLCMAAVLLLSMLLLSHKTADYVATIAKPAASSASEPEKTGKYLVIIDPGHGGIDPGKIGVGDVLEKEINLQIAKKVKIFLEQNDVSVIMTREEDIGLYNPSDSNKKVQDMKSRVQFIDGSGADLAVSIHQNAYQEEYVSGAQIFYYETSTEGEKLAEIMQAELTKCLKPEKESIIKANDSYYLLKKTKTPIIIAECGFLSNQKEAGLLITESYQNKVSFAIGMGILQYLNKEKR